MEHRHLDHHAVGRGEVHAVADALAVVDDVVMREHDPLGESRSTARVLHVADVVDIDGGGEAVDLLCRRHVRAGHGLLPGEAALHLKVYGDDVAQERQAAAGERLAGRRRLQLGAEFPHNIVVMRVAEALYHHERVGIRLAQQILGLVDLIGGIDGDEHRTDLRRRPECQIPLGQVRRPDRDVASGADAERYQRAREFVDVVAEFGVGAGIVQRCVFEGVLVGELLDDTVEHLREGHFNQLVPLPRIEPRAALVLIETLRLHHTRGAAKTVHRVYKMQGDQLNTLDVGHPLRIPLH